MRQRYTGVILVPFVTCTLVSAPIPVAFNQLTIKLFISSVLFQLRMEYIIILNTSRL